MANVRTIHVDWYSQRPPRFDGGPQLAYQGDHLSNMVVFDNAPELPNYYLLVEMKTDDEGPVTALPAIQLEGPYWVIPNYYTQICQIITYQVCCKTGTNDYERHSAKFYGTILPVIEHLSDPATQEPMFDPYMAILNRRVKDLIDEHGEIVIDQEKAAETINTWLDAHPEATTTVEDGAISEAKLASALKLKITNAYVTPEMYGAVGDGKADDTKAIQSAVNNGYKVLFSTNSTYSVTGQISIDNPCIIDGCNCNILLHSSSIRKNIFYVNSDHVTIKNFRVNSERLNSFVNGENAYQETLSDNNSFIYINDGDYGIIENIDTNNVFSAVFFGYGDENGLLGWNVRNIVAKNALMGVHLALAKKTVIEGFDLELASDANLYCHAIYMNLNCDDIIVRNGKLTASLTPVSVNVPMYTLIDCHVNNVGNTLSNITVDAVEFKNNTNFAIRMQMVSNAKITRCSINSPQLSSIQNDCTGIIFDGCDFSGDRLGIVYNTQFTNMRITCILGAAMHQITGCKFSFCLFNVASFVTTTYNIAVFDSVIKYQGNALSIRENSSDVDVSFVNCKFLRDSVENYAMRCGEGVTGNLVILNCTAYNAINFAQDTVTTFAKMDGNYAYK